VSRPTNSASRVVPLLWSAAFGALIWVLLRAPGLRVGASLNSSQPYTTTWTEIAPEQLAIEILKLTVLAIASWLLLITLVSILLFSTGYVRTASQVVRLMPQAMQAAIRPALAITLTASMFLPSISTVGAIESGTQSPEAVLIHLGSTVTQPETPHLPEQPQPPDTTPKPSLTMQPAASSETRPGLNIAELTHLDSQAEETAGGQDDRTGEGRGGPVGEATGTADSHARNDLSIWIVEPGEHLWSISERLVATNIDHPISDKQVSQYWLQLIEANRSSLPDPRNPDLIYPGMRLRLPAGSGAGLGPGHMGSPSQPS